jgi:cobalt/nickel transport system ATP-binding protein
MTAALEVSDLRFGYDGVPVLRDIAFEVRCQESVALVGGNGSGKSTLLWCIAGLLTGSGRVRLFDEASPNAEVLARLAMVFQNPEDQLFMPNLIQDLTLPLLNSGIDAETARRRAEECLHDLGLEKYGDRPATHLSIGQRKGAAVALALVQCPELLLLDEPTAELDGRAVRRLAAMLCGLNVAKLIASHDLRFLQTVTTRALVLSEGRIIADGNTADLLSDQELLNRAGLV